MEQVKQQFTLRGIWQRLGVTLVAVLATMQAFEVETFADIGFRQWIALAVVAATAIWQLNPPKR